MGGKVADLRYTQGKAAACLLSSTLQKITPLIRMTSADNCVRGRAYESGEMFFHWRMYKYAATLPGYSLQTAPSNPANLLY